MCSINLSGQSLGDDKFLPYVIDQFHRSGLDATKICFEITETAAIASFSQANRFIQALKELGCKFALDDFGTGLSSFGYLKHFPRRLPEDRRQLREGNSARSHRP